MNSRFENRLLAVVGVSLMFLFSLRAEVVTATIQTPPPAETGYFKLGTTKNPAGHEIGVNSRSLLFDGQPWFPIMGEMHFSRVPQAEWRDELLKMKAGGVDIVATYVFWIHHEEIEGQWDWTGQRDLKKFLQTCNEVGLKAVSSIRNTTGCVGYTCFSMTLVRRWRRCPRRCRICDRNLKMILSRCAGPCVRTATPAMFS